MVIWNNRARVIYLSNSEHTVHLNALSRQCLAVRFARTNDGDRIAMLFAALHESAIGPKLT